MHLQLLHKGNQYDYKQQEPNYTGQTLDQLFVQGPLENRSCRDLFFVILFILFWVGQGFVTYFAFTTGDPKLLIMPFDKSGHQCGNKSNAYKNYPYMLWFNNFKNFTCIDQCPSNANENRSCLYNFTEFNCTNITTKTKKCIINLLVVNLCIQQIQSNQVPSQVRDSIETVEKWINDIIHVWPVILITVVQAIIISLIIILLLRLCAGCFIFGFIFLFFLSIVGLGIYSFFYGYNKKQPSFIKTDPKNLEYFAYAMWAIAVFLLILIICFCSKIKIAIAIIKAACDFTRQQCSAIIIPIIMMISITLFFAFWFVVSIYLFTSGKVKNDCIIKVNFFECIQWNVGVKRMLLFNLFSLFWNIQFSIGLCQFVIASVVSYWYFYRDRIINCTIWKSYKRGLTYHFGSIAFGSLIIAIILILRVLLQLFRKTAKNHSMGQSQNCLSGFLIKCCKCCLACFERFIRFISKNAFLLMAVTGQGFCTAAEQAFYLNMRFFMQTTISHGLGHLVMFFAKLLITALSTFSSYLIIANIPYFNQNLFEFIIPILIFMLVSFIIASIFMDLIGIGADSILMCYMIQLDILKHTKKCPYSLKQFLKQYQ